MLSVYEHLFVQGFNLFIDTGPICCNRMIPSRNSILIFELFFKVAATEM